MKTDAQIIKNTHIKRHTDLPVYSEAYHLSVFKEDAPHSHEFFEIGITLSGEALHKTGLGTQPLRRGHVYFIPIGASHEIEVLDSWHVQNLYFLPRLILQNLSGHPLPNPRFYDFLLSLLRRDRDRIPLMQLDESVLSSVEDLLRAMETVHLEERLLMENFRNNCLLNILMILCDRFIRCFPHAVSPSDARMQMLLSDLCDTIEKPTSDIIDLISRNLQLNPQYINKLVKATFGISLSALILETKIERSCELLLDGLTVSEAAHQLSFYDHSHYNKYFHRYFGISPSRYREKYRSDEPRIFA